ncbi:restriction endonuclease subunit S [Bacteroides acidifaciens]|uniref:restriction endonuclease subunit S n=1 Tax=Bacteroides acidifaciens TaxID=85831 RepID=UPI00158E38E0|nr:restriction endonuclease subunit S [Bacteroides acidifaciens]
MRFPEFSGEWEKNNLSKFSSKITKKNKGNFIKNVLCNSANLGIIPQNDYFDRDIANADNTDSYYIIEQGDFVYNPRKSTAAPYGPVNIYNGEKPGIISPLYLCFSVFNISPSFLFYRFKSSVWHPYVYSHGDTGVRYDRVSIKDDVFFDMPIYTPTQNEQEKIATLLSLIDERIATQNKIIEDLKKSKSAISLKMLHSDSWEQFRIKDIAIIGRGRVISSVEISQQKNPTYPVYSSQTSNEGIMGYLDDYMFEGEYISWTTDGANAGTVFYRNGKFNCTNVCGLLKLKKGFDTHFVSLVLAEATKKYVSVSLANPKLMNNTMGNIQIRLPKLEEQKRISIVFRRLHELLATHNSLLTEYSKQKQYLLSQMFI